MTARAIAAGDLNTVGGATTVELDITTGASPVDMPLQDSTVYRVIVNLTSGGTGGVEILNLPFPVDDDNGGNTPFIRQEIILRMVAQTDGDDIIQVKQNTTIEHFVFSPLGESALFTMPELYNPTLEYQDANMRLEWNYYSWALAPSVTGWNFSFKTNGGAIRLKCRESALPDTDGVSAELIGSDADGTGIPGQALVKPGTGGLLLLDLNSGRLQCELPTSADGLTTGQWWNNAGVPNIV